MWGGAYEDALKSLGITEDDFRNEMRTDELVEFISEYLPRHSAPTDIAMINRIVTVMAYVLALAYPDESVRKLFAGFCQSLISYGGEQKQCDDESNTV